MTKFSIFIRNLFLAESVRAALAEHVLTEQQPVAPGQIRLRNDWHYLTYLRVVKLKSFDADLWEMIEQEVDCIRVVAFQARKNKLLVHGSKSEIKEVQGLFEALSLKAAGSQPGATIDFNNYYRIETPEVDLNNMLEAFEKKNQVADIRKLRLKDMEVKLGNVSSCIINTNDYGGVKKVLAGHDENKVVGLEIKVRDQEKTYIYVDVDAQVRISTNSEDTDFDLEKMAIEVGLMY